MLKANKLKIEIFYHIASIKRAFDFLKKRICRDLFFHSVFKETIQTLEGSKTNYWVTGSLIFFGVCGQKRAYRYNDIDIVINEKDLDQIQALFKFKGFKQTRALNKRVAMMKRSVKVDFILCTIEGDTVETGCESAVAYFSKYHLDRHQYFEVDGISFRTGSNEAIGAFSLFSVNPDHQALVWTHTWNNRFQYLQYNEVREEISLAVVSDQVPAMV